MALWLVRAGEHGEHEQRFLNDNRIYLTWEGLNVDLSAATNYNDVKAIMSCVYPDEPPRRLGNWTGQVWAFAVPMQPGDWVILPRKTQPVIAVGEITGPYKYTPEQDLYAHSRTVQWLNTEIPRTRFDQDLLYSFGAFLTVCQISRNDAEKRVRAMRSEGWVTATPPPTGNGGAPTAGTDAVAPVDLDRVARDQIANLITRRFAGHNLTRLVEAILRAQGYQTYRSPEGPDKGVDILAAPGALGFAEPRICVQVKSGDTPVDHPTVSQLIGTMQNVRAEHGLFVSWAGFKSSVEKDRASMFFRVRLWNQDDVIEQLFEHYDKLDETLRTELPLKRIWVMAAEESGA